MSSKSYDPLKMVTSSMVLWMETARTMQTQYINAISNAAESAPAKMSWKTMEVPVLSIDMGSQEKRLQETFQRSANMNISSWTHAANMLSALPSWADWSTHIPSRAMTDRFDKMRPKPSYPAPKASKDEQGASK